MQVQKYPQEGKWGHQATPERSSGWVENYIKMIR